MKGDPFFDELMKKVNSAYEQITNPNYKRKQNSEEIRLNTKIAELEAELDSLKKRNAKLTKCKEEIKQLEELWKDEKNKNLVLEYDIEKLKLKAKKISWTMSVLVLCFLIVGVVVGFNLKNSSWDSIQIGSKNAISELKQEITNLEQNSQNQIDKISNLQQDSIRLRQNYATLEQNNRNLRTENEKLRTNNIDTNSPSNTTTTVNPPTQTEEIRQYLITNYLNILSTGRYLSENQMNELQIQEVQILLYRIFEQKGYTSITEPLQNYPKLSENEKAAISVLRTRLNWNISLNSSSNTTTTVNPQPPIIRTHPSNGTVREGRNRSRTISVKANPPTSGSLSYQWYSNTNASNRGGTPIRGATSSSYNVPVLIAGEYYHYVVVTNTQNGRTATVTSNVAKTTVRAGSVFDDPIYD